MNSPKNLLGLDVGTVRIGYAIGDALTKIAVPRGVIAADDAVAEQIRKLINDHAVSLVVVGYPRNQSGDPTAQTEYVEMFVKSLGNLDIDLAYQDESLSSVIAEQRLNARKKSYKKEDIDSEAAAIILQDYMEQRL